MFKVSVIYFLLLFAVAGNLFAKTYPVANIAEFNKSKKELKPNDTLLLINGLWKDAELKLTNEGKASAPIYIAAETPGRVILTGNSKVKIGGKYIIVSGLVFKNGFTVAGSVIEFRSSSSEFANHCRVTNCVFDNYNKPNRLESDNWIVFYGRDNRFDHNYVAGKKNLGTTLVVQLNDTLNQQNHHRIDHNYFGERPRMGSNGGETMRIGNSTFSRTSSQTVVEDNYFEHCNGEVEVVSIKSGENIVRRNTFYECEGGLVLRHGNNNQVYDNYFIGNHKPNTGGVRIINAGHKVYNNFFYGLAGDRFRAALCILNGVPNSPINRYDQVKDVVIAANVFLDCSAIELSAGRDLERTARPENVLIMGNLFDTEKSNLFKVNDTLDGIAFMDNYSNIPFANLPQNGFKVGNIEINKEKDGWRLLQPKSLLSKTALETIKRRIPVYSGPLPSNFVPFANATNTGVAWYKPETNATSQGKRLLVRPGVNTMYDMAAKSKRGDTLQLESGEYFLSKTVELYHPLVIMYAGDLPNKPIVNYSGDKSGFTFFRIENSGALTLKNIKFDGLSEHGIAQSFIETSLAPMIEHYSLFVDGCDFINITDGRKSVLKVNKASYADTISFANCIFNDISGPAINIAAEKEDLGIYNAEVVEFRNCLFNKILLNAIDLYRGGNDESTTGPYFIMDHCVFNEVANIELGAVVNLIGVQHSNITNTIFNNSGRAGRVVKYEDYGWAISRISYCDVYQGGVVESFYKNIIGKGMLHLNPQFRDIGNLDFQLVSDSPLKGKGSDGKDMGCVWQGNILNNK